MSSVESIYKHTHKREALLKALHAKDLILCIMPNGLDRLKDLGVVTVSVTHDAFAAPHWAVALFCDLTLDERWVIRYLANAVLNDPPYMRSAMTVLSLGGKTKLLNYVIATAKPPSIALPPVLDSGPF